jgi:hypothetical protein
VCGAHITINATSSLLHLDRSLLRIRCIPLLVVIHLTNHSPNQSERRRLPRDEYNILLDLIQGKDTLRTALMESGQRQVKLLRHDAWEGMRSAPGLT